MFGLATSEIDPDTVTPGVLGFVATIVVVVAVFLLVFDMVRRIRRVSYREEVRARLDAEEAAAAQGSDAEQPGGAADAAPPASGERDRS